MIAQSSQIDALPNEILIAILSKFRTVHLLPLTLTSHRFHDLILRILHHRLLEGAALKDHKLILECFHPSTKLSTPYLFCEYLGTRGLSDPIPENGDTQEDFGGQDIYQDAESTERLGKLAGLYSHFRPVKPDSNRPRIMRHPAGGVFQSPNGLVDRHNEFVCQNIHLESHELFSQLCTLTNIVKVGPRRGLFLSCVGISEGIMRIWREWLSEQSKVVPSSSSSSDPEDRILWADNDRTVGLRMSVIQRDEEPAPVLVRAGEDLPVSYTLQYEELVIKTTHLLLMVEKSIDQEVQHSGKAIVIGTWDT